MGFRPKVDAPGQLAPAARTAVGGTGDRRKDGLDVEGELARRDGGGPRGPPPSGCQKELLRVVADSQAIARPFEPVAPEGAQVQMQWR